MRESVPKESRLRLSVFSDSAKPQAAFGTDSGFDIDHQKRIRAVGRVASCAAHDENLSAGRNLVIQTQGYFAPNRAAGGYLHFPRLVREMAAPLQRQPLFDRA